MVISNKFSSRFLFSDEKKKKENMRQIKQNITAMYETLPCVWPMQLSLRLEEILKYHCICWPPCGEV